MANNYGNLCQRVVSFSEKNTNLTVPIDIKFNNEDKKILSNYSRDYTKLINCVDRQDINSYVKFIIDQLFAANKYFNDQEPWKKKSDKLRLNTIIYVSLELIRKITILLYPIIPDTSIKVMNIFNLNINDIKFVTLKENENLKKGSKINKIGILFKKIENND